MTAFIRPRSGGFVEAAGRLPSLIGAELSVVMVVYRTGPALVESLRRVLADGAADEFVIVDNGSTAEEVAVMDAAASRDPRLQILRGHGNVGFARGANLGASAAHGRVLVFLNPDAFLEPGCLEALRTSLHGRPSPCLIGARVMNTDGTEQRGARRGEVTPVTTLLSLTHLAKAAPGLRRFEIHHEDQALPDGPIPAPTISGACFAMTRADFSAIGGFDEGYFLHVEDVDLCWRVRQSGGEVLFHPGARVVHLGSTSKKAPVVVEFWKGLGLARYFRKRADRPSRRLLAFLLAPLIVVASVARPILRGHPFTRPGPKAAPDR
jgi:N-acetylglucosaminyl-diphospho-decaprenol L-rhamnosyltransferase